MPKIPISTRRIMSAVYVPSSCRPTAIFWIRRMAAKDPSRMTMTTAVAIQF